MRHWTEDHVIEQVKEHALSLGCDGLYVAVSGIGYDFKGTLQDKDKIFYEAKACSEIVKDSSHSNQQRSGRFVINPKQYSTYGTDELFYIFILYAKYTIKNVRIIKSSELPQKENTFVMHPDMFFNGIE